MFLLCARFKTVRNSQGGSSERRFVIAVPGSGRRRDSVLEFFLILTARNPLKSPESDERIQENPSPFSWSGLVWIWFGLEQFGLRRSQTAWPVAPASPSANGAPGAGVAKATAPGGLQNRPELSKPAATDASRSVAATCCEDSAAGDWGESACAIFGARELSHRPWGRYTSEG